MKPNRTNTCDGQLIREKNSQSHVPNNVLKYQFIFLTIISNELKGMSLPELEICIAL